MTCFYAYLIVGKMYNNKEGLRHGRVIQNDFFCMKKVRPSRLVIGETLFVGEGSSSKVNVSSSSSSRIHVSFVVLGAHLVLESPATSDVIVYDGFP